ncbi:glycosyl hydrolase [Herbidospora mongoliensis]|uniref:glycosyl hydrolase n=1 Tax=Herbidospora mongoliensis TaxID=688067 RepID=UPI0009FF67E3|nr:glycosyl hydrolase [Herbidospora mongoliensis]
MTQTVPRRRIALVGALVAALGASLFTGVGPAEAADTLVSQGRPAVASSVERGDLSAAAAFDGKTNTRWSSKFADPQWIRLDLGKVTPITRIVLNWEAAYATAFQLQTSNDAATWKTIHTTTAGKGGVQTVNASASARYVRLYSTKRKTVYGTSLWEFQVFGSGGTTTQPTSTPTTTPKPTPSTQPSTQPPATVGKKGVAVWQIPGVNAAVANSQASWYYTWAVDHQNITTPANSQFVPMIWGVNSVTDANLAKAKAAGPYLLGFNEPDFADQSNITVEKALDLWPRLQDAGKILGAPAVAWGGDRAGGWLDRFMTGVKQRGYRVDFIPLHWYGGDFVTERAVGQLKGYLQAVYDRYKKPIWLTEFALIDFSNGTRFPTEAQQAAFVTESAKMLQSLPFVERYAWFGIGAGASGVNSGLFRDNGTPTQAGRAFQALPR